MIKHIVLWKLKNDCNIQEKGRQTRSQNVPDDPDVETPSETDMPNNHSKNTELVRGATDAISAWFSERKRNH